MCFVLQLFEIQTLKMERSSKRNKKRQRTPPYTFRNHNTKQKNDKKRSVSNFAIAKRQQSSGRRSKEIGRGKKLNLELNRRTATAEFCMENGNIAIFSTFISHFAHAIIKSFMNNFHMFNYMLRYLLFALWF